VKNKLKRIVIILLSVFAAMGLALVASSALAHGGLDVVFSSSPRFPIAGQETVLTYKISDNGTPEAGLGQEVMVMMAQSASGGHTHGPLPADAGNGSAAMPADMPGMDMGGAQVNAAPVMLMPVETAPGVYVAKYTFTQGGRYVGTVQVGDEEADTVVGVRTSPIAWPFIFGLAGLCAVLAGTVAVVKTVKREW
jgi:hypothetical protein